MAFIKSSRPTISTRKIGAPARRTRLPRPAARPARSLPTLSRFGQRQRRQDERQIIDATCVAITMWCRFQRSAASPPSGANRKRESGPRSRRFRAAATTRERGRPAKLRDVLHPGADQRDHLAAEKKLEIAVAAASGPYRETRTGFRPEFEAGERREFQFPRAIDLSIVRWNFAPTGFGGFPISFGGNLEALSGSRADLRRRRSSREHARRIRRYGQSASRKKISPSRGFE